jgi:hypothetical protein
MARKQGLAAQNGAGKRAGWEYRIVRLLSNAGLTEEDWMGKAGEELSALGAQGWELCAQTKEGHCVFKRGA